jgi:hypothetical protein
VHVCYLDCVASCRLAQTDLLVDRSLRFLLCPSKSDRSCCIACLRRTSGVGELGEWRGWFGWVWRWGAFKRFRELEFEDWATLGACCSWEVGFWAGLASKGLARRYARV